MMNGPSARSAALAGLTLGLAAFAFASASAMGCSDLRAASEEGDVLPVADGGKDSPEAGAETEGGAGIGGETEGGASSGGDGGPGAACRPFVLPCLDATPANVIEAPTEMSLAAALAAAKAGDIVQVKGVPVGPGSRVPPFVTLRGCGGATIAGSLGFKGTSGVVEGFTVTSQGSIVANVTGDFVVRQNRFVGPAAGNEAGVSGRSIDGLVSAEVTLLVEANVFEGRSYGAEAATSYDTGTRSVGITIRNNVFRGVANPVRISEGGLVGKITARIEHNTFYDFETAIGLFSVDRVTKTSGNVFAKGASAIKGSMYEVAYSFAWDITTPAGTPPLAGDFASADPRFVDAPGGDFRPSAGSPLVDVIPNGAPIPGDDVNGCPRPAGPSGAPPRADVGAYENP